MRLSTSLACASLAALVAAACTDALVDGDYRGEVLVQIKGFVEVADREVPWPEGSLRVAVFWYTAGQGLLEEQSVGASTDFPSRYTLNLYSPPPESSMQASPWGPGRIAIGIPMIYQDLDNDQVWDTDREQVVGGSDLAVLVYSTQAFQAWRLPDGWDEWLGDTADTGPVFDTGVLDPDAEGWEQVELEAGYHLLEGYVSLCETSVAPFQAYERDDVRIVVGRWWDELFFDCEGFCPVGDDLQALCDAPRSSLEPWEEDCLEECL